MTTPDPWQGGRPPQPNQPPQWGHQPGQQWGAAPPPGYYPPMYQHRATNALAIAAFVCAFCVSPVAIVLGHIALSQIKRTNEEGKGLAVAGLIIGYVSTAFSLLLIILFIMAGIFAGTEDDDRPTYNRYTTRSMPTPMLTAPVSAPATDVYPSVKAIKNAGPGSWDGGGELTLVVVTSS